MKRKVCFSYNAAYANSKDLTKRKVSDKVLKDRAYKIALNPTYGRYQRELPCMVHNMFFDKKIGSGAIATSKARANVNEMLAQGLHK